MERLGSLSTSSINLSTKPAPSFSTLPTRALVRPRRWDIAVKHRLFRHMLKGGDPESVRVYKWHIAQRVGARIEAGIPTDRWKLTLNDYLASAQALLLSMVQDGFSPHHPIPVDRNGEILGGAHRLACALALNIETVPVARSDIECWAPAWNEAWFRDHGMQPADLDRLREDWQSLRTSNHGTPVA